MPRPYAAPMTTRAQQIRDLLTQNRPLVMGGVYDGLSTRLAHRAGFEVLFVGGFSVAATLLTVWPVLTG